MTSSLKAFPVGKSSRTMIRTVRLDFLEWNEAVEPSPGDFQRARVEEIDFDTPVAKERAFKRDMVVYASTGGSIR